MKIRRFYGSNIRAALRQVTEEFGEDAAILSNKKVAGGVEVIAAEDYDSAMLPAASREFSDNGEPAQQENNLATSAVEESFVNAPLANDPHTAPHKYSKAKISANASRHANKTTDNVESIDVHSRSAFQWSLDPSLQAMKEELALMRSMMAEQLNGIGWQQFGYQDPLSAMLVRRLSHLGLDNEMIQRLLPQVDNQQDGECAWQQLLALFSKSLPLADLDLINNGGIYAFMGPAGVGKTTTIAKLAARCLLEQGKGSVALITMDNHRISAQEQITTFGRLMEIPAAKVSSQQPLDYWLKKFAAKKLILIDTGGMSSADQTINNQLQSLCNNSRSIHKFLLLSAANQQAVLQSTLKLYAPYSPASIIVTKLDEAASLGEVLSVASKTGLPITYTTDGQRIPEDLRVARSHHLVSKAVWLANKHHKDTDDWTLAQTIQHLQSA